MPTLTELNQISQAAFTDTLGAVFEDTPEIATRAWLQRPFTDIHHLHQVMGEIMHRLSDPEQMALIQAHPDLGSRLKMADASVKEQASVGLDQLTQQEYHQFVTLNQAYRAKFGFPFIIAVRNHTRASILQAFQQRLDNAIALEKATAMAEILKIAWFRLKDLVN
jgi:2-oxo-4-hydroxy-4-carboxy-5-ureidoimidazoline decarboxylase